MMASNWKKDDFHVFMVVLHCIHQRYVQRPDPVSEEELADLLLCDPAAKEIVDDAHKNRAGESPQSLSEEFAAWFEEFTRTGFYGRLVEREQVDGQWTFRPANSSLTQSQADELLAFLPKFEAPGTKYTTRWAGGEKNPDGSINAPYPVYTDDVKSFFAVVTRVCLAELFLCHRAVASNMMQDTELIHRASVSELKMMFAFCQQIERFGDGNWERLLKEGKISQLLRRLATLRETGGLGASIACNRAADQVGPEFKPL